MVRQWRILEVQDDYLDILHCTKKMYPTSLDKMDFISFCLSTKKGRWFFVPRGKFTSERENINLFETQIFCPFCGEEMPNYIKFQAKLLTS